MVDRKSLSLSFPFNKHWLEKDPFLSGVFQWKRWGEHGWGFLSSLDELRTISCLPSCTCLGPSVCSCPWDSPGKNTGVGYHFLLQCMKVKSESEVAQPCPTLLEPMDRSLPGSSVRGIFQARVLELGAIAFSLEDVVQDKDCGFWREMHRRAWHSPTVVNCGRYNRFCFLAYCYCCYCSDSLWLHGLQHTRLLCLPLCPGVFCPLSLVPVHWVGDAILPSHPLWSPFSCLQSFPASWSFPMSRLFTSGGRRIGASASASDLPVNIQGWFSLGFTGLISLQSEGFPRVFSSTSIWKHQFFGAQPSLRTNIHTWLLEKP